MAERGLCAGSRVRGRDSSAESLVFTHESNFSIFSSASPSIERCSFASDAHDYDCRPSDVSLRLEGDNDEYQEGMSGSDPGPNARKPTVGKKQSHLHGQREKAKVEKEDSYSDAMDGYRAVDMARNSFSLALKECQDRRNRSEALLNKVDRQRPASLDLNNFTASSPRLAIMKKSSLSPQMSGISMLQSPVITCCKPANAEIQIGWSSERVSLHESISIKHTSPTYLPFNKGRTLPSKWEDAERWIFSPASKDRAAKPSVPPPQRRPKSKSGPLVFPGIAYNSLYSPTVSMFEGPKVVNFTPSPVSAGVISEDGLAIHPSGHEADNPAQNQSCIARSVSVHGCSHMMSQNFDGIKDSDTRISLDVSKRDMATQMSPEDRSRSSKETWPPVSFSTSQPIRELKSLPLSKLEVKDVKVDERVTISRWSKKHKTQIPSKGQLHNKDAEPVICAWDASDTAKNITKVIREEAKITAWENLQKAKAEAAIRKLEMKLEKKRSSSMDKIVNKLKWAQKRAQEMRNSMLANQMSEVDRSSHKAVSSARIPQRTSLSDCFTCQAF